MDALRELPPLPKSLSGLINFSSSQWREVERVHLMRTMIQQDLSRSGPPPVAPARSGSRQRSPLAAEPRPSGGGSSTLGNGRPAGGPLPKEKQANTWSGRSSRLDAQLAVLRKEMVGLRQMDMSLLCQLWSLNESIQEYKQALQDRSPSWDPSHEEMLLGQLNGAPNMASAAAPPFDLASPVPPPTSRHQRSGSEGSTPRRYDAPRHPPRNLMAVPERTLAIDSSSGSSGEYDDVL
ncbi:uncharacterized protein LOC144149002 [Haemaphysalis longicornis]